MKNEKFIVPKRQYVGGNGTVWNLPNYDGELYTADQVNTPFLSAIGGLNGGLDTTNFEFPTSSLYTLPAASQPAITETAAIAGATASQVARTQNKNVVQIVHEAISISYEKMSNPGRLSGINTAGSQNNAGNELAFQQMTKLQKIARDLNYTCHNGSYQLSTDASTANKTRGMFELSASKTTLDAAGAGISKNLIDTILLAMYNAGAIFSNMVMYLNGFQKQKVSNIYGYAPTDRNIGGVNIKQIETDFGLIGIQLDRMVPAAQIGFYELSVIAPVFQVVPGKGRLFYEPIAKTGAAEKGQIYGHFGLDHGPDFMHGSITNLATS